MVLAQAGYCGCGMYFQVLSEMILTAFPKINTMPACLQ